MLRLTTNSPRRPRHRDERHPPGRPPRLGHDPGRTTGQAPGLRAPDRAESTGHVRPSAAPPARRRRASARPLAPPAAFATSLHEPNALSTSPRTVELRPRPSMPRYRSTRPASSSRSGSCQGLPAGATPSRARPDTSASAATWRPSRGSIHRSPAVHVGRMDGQSLAQGEPRGSRLSGQLSHVGPRTLRVDVIWRERAHATPVVDSRSKQPRQGVEV